MDARGQAAFAAALLDPALPPPAGLAAWNGSDPGRRFAIYRNNVVVSLLQALAARFPVTRALVGAEPFAALGRAWLAAEPPRSRLLHELGDGLPAFLERLEATAALPYLADLARLEAARTSAFHAADAEPLGPEAFARLDPARLDGQRVALHPSLRLVPSRWPIVAIWAAHQAAEPASVGAALARVDLAIAEDALVWRPGLEVLVAALPPGGRTFLAALAADRPLAAAAEAAAEADPAFDPVAALRLLAGRGLAASLPSDGEQPCAPRERTARRPRPSRPGRAARSGP